MEPPIADGRGVEDVFSNDGQVDLVVGRESALVSREEEQRRR